MAAPAKPAMLPAMIARFQGALAAALVLLVAFGAGTALRAYQAPEAPSGFAPKPLVTANRQMVVAANPLAAEAGLEILRKGGSALDAAIATQMVLNVVEPQSSGIGGGAFILTFEASSKTLTDIDGRETAPAGATPRLFLDAEGKPLPKKQAMESGRSVGVPGLIAALALAHERSGKLPWAELFEPAIAIARNGFAISPRLAKLLAEADPKSFAPKARAYFFDAQGRPWPTGHKLTNPELARTFETVAQKGPRAFYVGEIARDIAAAVQADPRGAGSLSVGDLATYRAKLREPVCTSYRAYEICGAGPPSSGAATVGQILALVEPFELGKQPLQPEAVHLLAEAERLAFADRDRYLADPDFVPAPVKGLLDRDYLAERRALIDPRKARAEVTAGTPPNIRQGSYGRDEGKEGSGTSHLSIVDGEGNAVSMTSSIEQAFGARLMVRGFLLNNELTDFSFLPADADGRPIANRVEPGKRPRSSMDPTMIFADGRDLRYLLGSPGGPAIIFYVTKAIVAMLDWGLDPQQAAALANFGAVGEVVLIEPGSEWNSLASRLEEMGHDVKRRDLTSGLHIIAVTPQGLLGGADPRREGAALGD